MVQTSGGRRNVFQIAENTAGQQEIKYRCVQAALSLMLHLMNGKAGDHAVKMPERGQFAGEIVGNDGYVADALRVATH